jgi:Lrp/AsnC family leucine-responsive transcriptional regulator
MSQPASLLEESANEGAMDAIDRKIIRELQANARLTNQELAERVGLSPSPCLRRVRNLEQAGVLASYAAVVDQDLYGLPISVFVSIKLERQTDATIRAFEAGVQTMDEVVECYLMTGNRDYLLRVVSDSLKSYERFVREVLTRQPGIASIESSFAFRPVKKGAVLPPLSHFD